MTTDTAAPLPDTTEAELDRVLTAAAAAAPVLGGMRPGERAELLRRVADALDAAAEELVPIAQAESHLPEARCRSELGRTTFQLRFFADVLDEGSYLEASVDTADPQWGMGPRLDVRRMLVPLGPVIVFGASNFPFAFSTAGGDTASALAAGCPVVVKAHPGHPRLAWRTGAVVSEALADAGAPGGAFAVVFGTETGRRAVLHPQTRAVGFTGSIRGGRALHDLAASRPDPIPFYGELGSLNPVFVTRAAMAKRGEEILSGYADSFTLGVGQFCTKPGVLLVPEGTGLDTLVDNLTQRNRAPLLNESVAGGFDERLGELAEHPVTEVLVRGAATEDGWTPHCCARTSTRCSPTPMFCWRSASARPRWWSSTPRRTGCWRWPAYCRGSSPRPCTPRRTATATRSPRGCWTSSPRRPGASCGTGGPPGSR